MNANNVLKALQQIASAADDGRRFVENQANIAEQFRMIRNAAHEAIRAIENGEFEIGANTEREVRNASRAIAMAMANEAGDSVEREVRRDEQMANTDADHRWP